MREAKLVHKFITNHPHSAPNVYDAETLGLMSVMDTLSGKIMTKNNKKRDKKRKMKRPKYNLFN